MLKSLWTFSGSLTLLNFEGRLYSCFVGGGKSEEKILFLLSFFYCVKNCCLMKQGLSLA